MADAPPPAYEDVTQSKKANPSRPGAYASSPHLDVPRNGIPTLHRRSMEDEGRPLPNGWIRQYDAKESHQFFVDTNVSPPRSIWHHPYDDDQYLSTLSSEERERLQVTAQTPSHADIAAESSADDSDNGHHLNKQDAKPTKSSHVAFELPERPAPDDKKDGGGGLSKLGRKVKDKLTASTHEERERDRERRNQEEQEAYARYQQIRSAMTRAAQTGQPQRLGKNADGQDVYMEPPRVDAYGNHMAPGGYGYGGVSGGRYQAYNPYTQGPYGNPNARFVAYPRPSYAYGRPYGRGYGGGMGLPLAGGVVGGMMLGGLLF